MSILFDFSRPDPATQTLFDKGVYPPEFDDDFKEYIRKRDRYKCAICKKPEKKVGTMDVHHINYTKVTVKVNCICLCRSCHTDIHRLSWSRKHEWASVLYQMALKREKIKTVEQLRKAWTVPDYEPVAIGS